MSYNEIMKIEGLRLDTLGPQALHGEATVEAIAPTGRLPDIFPGQRFNATVVSLAGQNALIELNGTPVVFAALQELHVGAELFVKVAQVAPKLLLEIAPQPVKSSVRLPPLTVGQELEAKIVEELADGTVLVDIEGAFLEADAPENVPVGKAFAARVEQLRPQVVLQLLNEALSDLETSAPSELQTQVTRLLRENIPHHTVTGESLDALMRELNALVDQSASVAIPASLLKLQAVIKKILPEQTALTAERLATFVRDSGLQYEAKLLRAAEQPPPDLPQALPRLVEGDLKGLLLQVLKDLNAARPPEAESRRTQGEMETKTLAQLTNHLEHIESQQAVNVLAQAQGEPYQLQIPLFTSQGITTAFLSIEAERQGNKEGRGRNKEKGKGYNILFMLDLEGFGQTRIDAHIDEKSLWVAFYVDRDEALALLKKELGGFRETLQSLSYDEVLLVAKPLGQLAPEKRRKFDALTIGAPTSVHLLDVKA
jgi:hypothetical protein